MDKEALFYKTDNDKIRCELCPHNCLIEKDGYGVCHMRRNEKGILIAKGYGNISSLCMDPIEKKPLYHFYPGANILSVGGISCNLDCSFCQNWQIAHSTRSTVHIEPQELVDMAQREKSLGIAFTYNEPSIWYEYVYDTFIISRKKGFKNVLITNGFINEEPLLELLPYVDAMNIDVKAFTEDFYRRICKGSLSDVLRTVELSAGRCHIEITNLVIHGLNDDIQDMKKMAKWIGNISSDIPLHISRYFPSYRMDIPASPIEVLFSLADAARQILNYVYIGNVPGTDNDTYCPQCGSRLIERKYKISVNGIRDGKCKNCHRVVSNIIV